jgi:hypothetical protein
MMPPAHDDGDDILHTPERLYEEPVLVFAGSKIIEQLGMPKLLEIHHAVPVYAGRDFNAEP